MQTTGAPRSRGRPPRTHDPPRGEAVEIHGEVDMRAGDSRRRLSCRAASEGSLSAALQRRPWADPPSGGIVAHSAPWISAVVRRDRDPPRPLRTAQPALTARRGTARAACHPSRRWAAERGTCRLPRGNLGAGGRADAHASGGPRRAPRRRRDDGASPGEPSFTLSVKASLAARGASRP
jgi:hypothetical protein